MGPNAVDERGAAFEIRATPRRSVARIVDRHLFQNFSAGDELVALPTRDFDGLCDVNDLLAVGEPCHPPTLRQTA